MRLTTNRLVVAVLFVGLFAMATRAAVDSDIWWHLAAGKWMVDSRQFLTADVFTHTFLGTPYYYPAWLTEIVMYWLFHYLGYGGLSLFASFFIVLAFVFVYKTCEGGPYLRAFCVIFAATASAVYWAARPHILSFALAAVFGYILHLWRWKGVNRLWLLPLLMALWVNLHPGFALGFIVIVFTLIGQVISASAHSLIGGGPLPRGVTGWRGVIWLIGIGLACAVAVSLNPTGPSLLTYPFRTVSIGVLQDFIQEWQSPNFHFRDQQVFIGLLLATLGAAGFSRRRFDVTDFVLVSGTAFLALVAARNISLFALVAAPVLTRYLDASINELRLRFPALRMPGERSTAPRLLPLNWAILGFMVLAALVKISLPLQPELNERERAKFLPVAAAQFIAQTRPPGPMFNSYNWGGFLQWALYGDYLVFVDGRTDLFPDAFLNEYIGVTRAQPGWRGVLDRYDIRLVVIESNSVLAEFLKAEPRWQEIYSDQQATVFSRAAP